MKKSKLAQFLHALPKLELHCHLYGTVRKETFIQMASRASAPLTATEIDVFYTRARKPLPCNDVVRALDRYLVKKPDDLYQITVEYLQESASHNVRYTEFFWNPTTTVEAGIAYPAAQDAILCAIRDAQAQFGIIGRLIGAIDRERSPAAALQMVEWVIHNRRPEVVGIGMDFNEADGPPELFFDAYRKARGAGLKVTAHAGENGISWKNIQTVIDLLGVRRVDHGYTVVDNREFARDCAARNIVFTVVPTNSYYLRTLADERWALDHPIRKMPELGLRVHPNTDNPTLHKVTPTKAWMMMVEDFGFGLNDLKSFMQNGLDAAWIDESQRRQWRREWTEMFDALSLRLEPAQDQAPI